MKDSSSWYIFCFGRDHHDDDSSSADGTIQNMIHDTAMTTMTTTTSTNKNDSITATPPIHDDVPVRTTTTTTTAPPLSSWETNLPTTGHPPTVSLLLQMDQVMVRRVLEHFTNYIAQMIIMMMDTSGTTTTMTTTTTTSSSDTVQLNVLRQKIHSTYLYPWIYSLLARLQTPLHRDDAVTMYNLLKHLTVVRSRMVARDDAPPPTTGAATVDSMHHLQGVGSDRTYLATLNVLIVIVGIYFEQGGNYANIMEVKSSTTTS
jgi:hypothetical protein